MNKVKLLALCLFVALGSILKAQNDLRMGPSIGLVPTWLTSDDKEVEATDGRFGLKVGLVAEKSFSDNFSLVGRLNYAFGLGGTIRHQYGGELLPQSELSRELAALRSNFSDGTEIAYNLSMLEIPFSLKIRSNQENDLRFFGELPMLALTFVANTKGDVMTNGQEFTGEKLNKDTNGLWLNWGLGAGVEYDLKDGSTLVLSAHYIKAFTDLTEDKGVKVIEDMTDEEDATIRLGQMAIGVAVMF